MIALTGILVLWNVILSIAVVVLLIDWARKK
jgi:hypothetical protein